MFVFSPDDCQTSRSAEPVGAGTRTVLVADSDPAHRREVAELLEAEGYAVAMASTGESALARIEAGRIDMLVCAVIMSRMDGFEVLRSLRERFPALPVVAVVSGMTEIDAVYMRGASALGAGRVYTQPLTPSVFLRGVRELLKPV